MDEHELFDALMDILSSHRKKAYNSIIECAKVAVELDEMKIPFEYDLVWGQRVPRLVYTTKNEEIKE